ncbi:MAG: response regulator [Candidatus Dormibacteraceae bacterium]
MHDPGTARPRILIVDDQTLFRAGLAKLLEGDERVELAGQAGDGQQALDLVTEVQPDVVLMDLRLPRLDGGVAAARIVTLHPQVKVLFLTSVIADTEIVHAIESGVSGYLLKVSEPDAIVPSILAALSGEWIMDWAVAKRMLKIVTGDSGIPSRGDLTRRELEILKLLARGMSNKQMAHQLTISDKTVRNHITRIYEKLDIADRAHAVLYAVRQGLIEP